MDPSLNSTPVSPVPSGALVGSTGSAVVVGGTIEYLLSSTKFALPPGSGAVLGSMLSGLFHYLVGHGRSQN